MPATSTAKKSKAPATMPIDNYDRLSVKAILPLLTTLSGTELRAVVAYEKAGKNRVTLLKSVRKVELAREEAARRPAPESHLTVVEDTEEPDADEYPAEDSYEPLEYAEEPVAIDADDSWAIEDDDSWGNDPIAIGADDPISVDADEPVAIDAGEPVAVEADIEQVEPPVVVPVVEAAPAPKKRGRIGSVARPVGGRAAASRAAASRAAASRAAASRAADLRAADPRPTAPTEAPEPVVVVEQEKKSRPAVKAATWEEEPRLELPKRMAAAASAFELDFEPAPVALVPPIPSVPSVPSVPSIPSTKASSTTAIRTSTPAKVRRKFEGAVLVMAAVLAVLLGLAIGTLLVRGGSVSAGSTPTSVSTQAATGQSGG